MPNHFTRSMTSLPFRALLLLVTVFAATSVWSQATSATVSGVITDPTGAKVPTATVTFTNAATGVVTTATSNGEGLYRLNGLLAGKYNATVTMQGFKTAVQQGIELHLEDQVSLDYTLAIGVSSDSVTISADANVLETQSPTVSQVIEGRQVEDTPLNGRNSMNLVALTPGVVPQGGTSGSSSNNVKGGAFTNTFGFNNYEIAGGLAGQASVYLDGTPLNLALGHPLAFVISQDLVQEFRVESSVVNPQYGEFGGGVISFATKSGTAKLHGTFYEYLRNNIFNANNFFNNATIVNGTPVPRPEFTQNQFGANAGGAIPHTKTFFFVGYEGFRLALGVPNLGRVPTLAERTGDFRADPAIFDPRTAVKNAAGVTVSENQISCNGVANVVCPNASTPGSGTSIDPTANYLANVINYFPLPNSSSGNPGINFSQNGRAASNNNQYNLRFDAAVGAKQKIFARYTRADNSEPGTVWLTNTAGGPTSGPGTNATSQEYALGDTIVLSPSSILDLRASYVRYVSQLYSPAEHVNLAALGPFWAAFPPQINYQEFPAISISNNISQPFTQLNPTGPSPEENYVLSGTYLKVIGKHSLSFGGEARQREEYFNLTLSSPGFFVFAGTGTACIPTGGPTTCKNPAGIPIAPTLPGAGATPIADFVTGIITAAPLGFTENSFPSAVNHYGGIFANDSFQITPRMTITAGVRYELPGGFTEKHDRNTVLLPQLSNPLVLVNSSAYPSRSDLQTHLTLVSPRVGVAFQPQPTTSVRAGYSLAFLPVDTVYTAAPNGSPLNSPLTFVTPGSPLSDPLIHSVDGPGTILQPIGRAYASNSNYFAGQTVSSRIPFSRFPYMQQWNATVQQTFGSTSALQLAYLGARGVHQPVFGTIDINQLPDQYDTMTTLTTAVSPGVTLGQTLRPYPMYQNVNAESPYYGDSYYDSLQATFNKRFAGGGTLLANYSWSKLLSNAESTQSQVETHVQGGIQDFNNLRAEKSYLSFDAPQRLVVSYILDAPFGRGKRFLVNGSDLVQAVAGGWNVSGINTFQSGFPEAVTATANNFANLFGAGTIRPNVVSGCNKRIAGSTVSLVQKGLPTLNVACFTAPAVFGNEPRTDGQLRDQGTDNWDFAVGKTTLVHDSINFVFRAEVFNLINRVQFGDPNLASGSSSLFGLITTQANSPRLFQFSLRANY